jgi:hypothetical protein
MKKLLLFFALLMFAGCSTPVQIPEPYKPNLLTYCQNQCMQDFGQGYESLSQCQAICFKENENSYYEEDQQ